MELFASIERQEDLQKITIVREVAPKKIFLKTAPSLRQYIRSQNIHWIEAMDDAALYSAARDTVDALYSHYSPETRRGEQVIFQPGRGDLEDERLGKIAWRDGDLDDFPIVYEKGRICPEIFFALRALEKDIVVASQKDLEISARAQTIIQCLNKDCPKWLHL